MDCNKRIVESIKDVKKVYKGLLNPALLCAHLQTFYCARSSFLDEREGVSGKNKITLNAVQKLRKLGLGGWGCQTKANFFIVECYYKKAHLGEVITAIAEARKR